MLFFKKILQQNYKKIVIVFFVVAFFFIIFGLLVTYFKSKENKVMEIKANLEVRQVDLSDLTAQMESVGENNLYRKVWHKKFGELVELATSDKGQLIYFKEIPYSRANEMLVKVQFLSKQGVGIIRFMALDEKKNVVAQVNDIFAAPLDEKQLKKDHLKKNKEQKVVDWNERYFYNYVGNWLDRSGNMLEWFERADFDRKEIDKKAAYCRIELVVGQGQHVLVKDFGIEQDYLRAIEIIPEASKNEYFIGEEIIVKTNIKNMGSSDLSNLQISCYLPVGYGILKSDKTDTLVQKIDFLKKGENRELFWHFKANRANNVNLNKPWVVEWLVNDNALKQAQINIKDKRAGKIYYVMTEDLEPIDGAGYEKEWGEKSGWLLPQEFRLQIVEKSERLNEIADHFGAKWTHYLVMPALEAALWAGSLSKTDNWQKVVLEIKKSVVKEAMKGHEYALHLHLDYDPFFSENTLSYNELNDGFWANHLRHGWAHSVKELGHKKEHDSRIGTLFYYQQKIDELLQNTSLGQILTARVGSFDFGFNKEEMAKSIIAYRMVGLWGSTDADANITYKPSRDYGKEIYFTQKDDINNIADNLENIGLVEFCPTPVQHIQYDSDSALKMNEKVNQAFLAFAPQGQVVSGVHAIVGMTHAIFINGNHGWKSTVGGQFQEIEKHLEFVYNEYAQKEKIIFATASEMVRNYLDYYTPILLAVYGEKLSENFFKTEYAIRLLGADIPVDSSYVHKVSIKYPLYLDEKIIFARVKKNGVVIMNTWLVPNEDNEISFLVDDKNAKYTMEIYHSQYLRTYLAWFRK